MVLSVYEIPDRLSELAKGFVDDPDRKTHIIFIHLYKNVTEEWITYAENTQSRDLIFGVIEQFYQKYVDYVVDPIEDEESRSRQNHWDRYFELVDSRQPFCHLSHFFEVLYAGAFADTRCDQVEPIEAMLIELPELAPDGAKLQRPKTGIIGVATNDVFARASHQYLLSIKVIVGEHHPPGLGVARHLNFEFLHAAWMKKFQGWCKLAWDDAIRQLA